MRKKGKILNMPVVIEKDNEGFFATCPTIQGCYSQGDTYEEVVENIRDAIKLCVIDEKSLGNFLAPSSVSLTSIEVQV